ncbi:hypothetical protein R9C00_07795 [Flammeovirgaceae bacterium SG7u.111]|nr:hypothetical protein [Flammeovirgaceae bacterium SG7u.132]WPO37349.1 hypothetical protein R9C00_07795 [Flammeovirgaceae bacterium SG7u.111]
MMIKEQWVQIDFSDPFFEVKVQNVKSEYEVSSWGRAKKDGELIAGSTVNGYKFIRVYLGYCKERKRGMEKRLPLHRVVAYYFVTNDDPDYKNYVSFRDNDSLNCQARNLQWIPHSEASRKGYESAVARGTWKGDSPLRKHVKLNKEKVKIIRERHSKGVAPKRLAQQFGVSTMQISRVVNHVDWKNA